LSENNRLIPNNRDVPFYSFLYGGAFEGLAAATRAAAVGGAAAQSGIEIGAGSSALGPVVAFSFLGIAVGVTIYGVATADNLNVPADIHRDLPVMGHSSAWESDNYMGSDIGPSLVDLAVPINAAASAPAAASATEAASTTQGDGYLRKIEERCFKLYHQFPFQRMGIWRNADTSAVRAQYQKVISIIQNRFPGLFEQVCQEGWHFDPSLLDSRACEAFTRSALFTGARLGSLASGVDGSGLTSSWESSLKRFLQGFCCIRAIAP